MKQFTCRFDPYLGSQLISLAYKFSRIISIASLIAIH